MEEQIFQPRTDLTALNEAVLSIRNEIKKIIVGQDEMVKLIIAALLADGHVLIEGVPGVAKTLTAKLVAKSVNAGFSRIQFTPDLMPSDVLGTPVFNPLVTASMRPSGSSRCSSKCSRRSRSRTGRRLLSGLSYSRASRSRRPDRNG